MSAAVTGPRNTYRRAGGLADIGSRMRALRIARGLTQSQIATAMQTSRGQVINCETGLSMPSLRNVVAFSRVVGCRFEEILLSAEERAEYQANIRRGA